MPVFNLLHFDQYLTWELTGVKHIAEAILLQQARLDTNLVYIEPFAIS
jgi:hypothetical protein